MQISDIPAKFPIPWANSAGSPYLRSIPTASQIGIVAGAASLTDGWPPMDALPVAAGGIPPDIRDQNGILKQITAWDRWVQAGGRIAWDSAFSAAIGGYPYNCQVASAVTIGMYWISTVDNNTTNPDTGGANWVAFTPVRGFLKFTASGSLVWPTSGLIKLTVTGGGASGGSMGQTPNIGGAGGGAGGSAIKWISGMIVGASVAVTIGAGGAAVSGVTGAGNGANGNDGTASSVGALVSATGGAGGNGSGLITPGSAAGGAGGQGFGGDLDFRGGGGQDGQATNVGMGGSGGNSIYGGAGTARTSRIPAIQDGQAPGAGGGAAYNTPGTDSGAGANGLVLAEW